MASAKTLYWATLAILATAFVWSHNGPCVIGRVTSMADRMGARASQYMAVVELAFGRTESGFGRMPLSAARLAAGQARMQAEQTRMQTEMVRRQMDQLMATRQVWQGDQALRIRNVVRDSGIGRELICPRNRVRMVVPVPPMPPLDLSLPNDPI